MTELALPVSKQSSRSDWRLILLIAWFCLGYGAVGLKMGLMAATEPVEPRTARTDAVNRPVRGEIVDRRGRLLAANLPAWSLYVHPHEIKDPVAVAAVLDPIFPEIDRETLVRRLSSRNRFEWIKRPITPRERNEVYDLGQPGLFFGSREMRIYPAGRTAAHIVGGVRAVNEGVRFAEFTGAGGVEQFFDARLRDPEAVSAPLELSLDLTVQQAMRRELITGLSDFNAKGAAAVLMKVATGEILGLVSLPDFDPNVRRQRFRGDPEFHPKFNRAAQGQYELGSTFKIFTAAMALEERVATASSMFETPRELRFGRHRIGDSHKMPPRMSLEDIVVDSSNVGTARIAMLVGTRRFRAYMEALGLFTPNGLELTEANAAPLLPDRWTDLSTVTASYGHGMAVSPVHLAAAYATVANRGVRISPTLIAGQARVGDRVFSQGVSNEILRIMREVVKRGTATRADVPGYGVAGKTGTANKVEDGRYTGKKVVASFAAVFPWHEPEYVLVVSLDEAEDRTAYRPLRGAGRTAVPVAAGIIARVAPLLGLRPLEEPGEERTAGLTVGTD